MTINAEHAAENDIQAIFNQVGLLFRTDVLDELSRSLDKWGVQNHPDGTSGFPHARSRSNEYRALTDRHAQNGHLTWWDILLEEVYEAGAETEYAALRAELVQVANVAALWVNDLDRREAARVAVAGPQRALEGTVALSAPVVPDTCDALYGGVHSHGVYAHPYATVDGPWTRILVGA